MPNRSIARSSQGSSFGKRVLLQHPSHHHIQFAAVEQVFFWSRLVRVLLLLKGIDPEAQIADRLYKWTGQMPMKRQKNLPEFVFVFNLSDG
jgi:hypothetical protein